jgi:hypothetical protein
VATGQGLCLDPREAALIASERRFLEKLERLLALGQPGVKQARREIAHSSSAVTGDLGNDTRAEQAEPSG